MICKIQYGLAPEYLSISIPDATNARKNLRNSNDIQAEY